MFLSVRRDAAHTPYGVLSWVVRQYLRNPSLKVPPHLQLSLNESAWPKDDVTGGALSGSLRCGGGGKARPKLVRLTRHKVLSILSRLTHAKYDALLNEMVLLPLRQECDEELREICKIFFDKAVQEPAYSGLYARLAHDICVVKDAECEPGSPGCKFSQRFCGLLNTLCKTEFQRPLQLSPDDLVDRTTGAPLDLEEVEVKRGRLKSRLVGNIRFVSELFRAGLVDEPVINEIVRVSVKDYNPDEPTAKGEHAFEMFQTLVRHTGDVMKKRLPHLLAESLAIAKSIELSHPKPRIVFLMMDLADLNRQSGWVDAESLQRHVRYPKAGKKTTNTTATKKGSSIVPPLSRSALAQALALPSRGKNIKTVAKVINAASPSHILGEGARANGKGHLLDTEQAGSNQNGKIIKNPNGYIASNVSNNDSISINRRINDVSGSSASANGVGWQGQHQPYRSIVLTPVINFDSDIHFDINNNSIELFQHTTPSSSISVRSEPLFQGNKVRGRGRDDMGDKNVTSCEGLVSMSSSCVASPTGVDTTVNMKEVTEQLMTFFRNGDEATAIAMLREMDLKSIVLCLTWWLRLVSTNTSFFEDRSKVALLISSLLADCGGSYEAKDLFSLILEWIRFDVEKAEYDNCPRMFGNMAQMILQCHLPCSDTLPYVNVLRDVMQCGLFNVLLRELTISGGTDQMVTAVKSCYPVTLHVLDNLHDPEDDRQILRIAAQNRFRLLPYLLSVSSVTSNAMPGLASVRPTGQSSPLLSPLRSSIYCDSLTSTGRYDPLESCLMLQRVMDDAEFVIFRTLREAAADGGATATPPRWHEDALQLALSPLGNRSTVCELVAVMRVVGALLACSSVGGGKGRTLASGDDLDSVVGEILSRRPGILYQGAAAVELIMYYTQTLNDVEGSSRADPSRMLQLKRVFARWCELKIIHRLSVLDLLDVLDNPVDKLSIYAAYHGNVADVPWHVVLRELRAH